MFLRVNRYKICKKDLSKWKSNNDAANQIYRECGAERLERIIRRNGDGIEVMELGYYKSRGEFERIVARVDKDERIDELFREFKKMVTEEVTNEEYETI